MKKFTLKHIQKVAKKNDARGFYEWLEVKNVDHVIHDVTLSDPNDGYMIVSIEIEDNYYDCVDVMYCDGELEEADGKTHD